MQGEQKHRISDFAKSMNISQEGLRYYEREGIITPERDERSNYRKFGLKESASIISHRKYVKYGFSQAEATALMRNSEFSEAVQTYSDKEKAIEQEIKEKELLLEHLRVRKAEIKDAVEHLDVLRDTHRRTLVFAITRKNLQPFYDEANSARVIAWNKHQPFPDLTTVTQYDERTNEKTSFTGLLLEKEMAERLGLDWAREFPAAEYYSIFRIKHCYELISDSTVPEFLSILPPSAQSLKGPIFIRTIDIRVGAHNINDYLIEMSMPKPPEEA